MTRPRPRLFFILAVLMFIALSGLSAYVNNLPPPIPLHYLILSIITYIIYGIDKSAAKGNHWRTRESTLHLLALAGGWPGAMAAQQILKHKSVKLSFRKSFLDDSHSELPGIRLAAHN